MRRCQRARAILAILATLVTLVTLALCLVGARPATALELTEGERAGIIDVLASVYMVRDDFELGDVDFEQLEVGEPIPSYEAFDDGLVRSYDHYPLYFEGRMVTLALNRGDDVFEIGATPAAQALANAGCERAALIFDRSACYVWDGVRLQRLYGFVETVDDRADLSCGADPARFSDVEMAGLDDLELLGFDLARDLTARSDDVTPAESAPEDDASNESGPVVLLACLAGVTLIALGLRSRRQA